MSDTDSSSYSYSDDFDQAPVTAAPLPALPDSDTTPVPAFQQQHDLPTSTRKGSNGVETASQPAAAAPSLTASTHSSRRTAASSPTPDTADPIADPETPPPPPAQPPAAAGKRQQRQDAGAVAATDDEVAEIQGLKEENEGLRQQVIGLNNQLNDALNQRGEKVVQITRAPTKQSADADRIQKDIDRLRKLNGKLNDRLRQSDAAGRIVELQNVLNEKLREVEILREDNRSLENVHRNQAKRLATVDEAEARIRTARDHHMEEVRQLKEKIQEYKGQKVCFCLVAFCLFFFLCRGLMTRIQYPTPSLRAFRKATRSL